MNWLKEIALALRMLQRDSHSGEIGLLAAAIVIAVASLTTVEFFTGRVEQALARQSNQLLGADLTISSDRPLDPEFEQNAHAHGLKVTHALRFPSMAVHVDGTVLTEIKAVADGYPLRGELRIADQLFGAERVVHDAPAAGTVWVDARLLTSLNLKIGDKLKIGQAGLRVVALVTQEPDSMTGFFNSLPRLLMNEADVAATGLIQRGSRVRYIFYVAGDAGVIDAYRTWAQQHVASWQHIENVRDARPEVRSTLERAGHFLGLAALLSVIIAAVAIALTARRFVVRHLDACAVMRCFGARQAGVVRLYSVHFLLLGLGASVVGCIIGYLAQTALAAQLAGLIAVALPQPGWLPAAHGLMTGIILLAGFALPPLMSLGQVPALRVLRRDIRMPRGFGALGYALGAGAICGLVLWQAHDFRLGIYVLGAFLAFAACSVLLVRALIALLGRVRTEGGVNWRYGIANLRRRTLGSVVQIVAFSVGIMALLTLTLIRGDLLTSWKVTLRPDLPDRFIINIQPDQTRRLAEFFSTHGVSPPPLFPMVRGRLVAINGRTVSPDTYPSDRAKRLVDREFNLSWADRPQPDNRIIAGQWWNSGTTQGDQLSVEEGIAETLGLKLGDALTYDVAGSRFIATITNLRKVDWDSFQVNFFVIAPPVLLQRYPASFITSFHAPSGETTMLNQLVREFPNLVMIDVAQIMAQVQHLIDQVARAVQFVFLFTLAAGLAVLYAAIASTRDERGYEAAIMRVLGARRGQVMVVQLAEFALIGALAGLLAATGASVLGYVLAHRILRVPYVGSPWIWPLSVICGGLGIAASGWLGVRRVLAMPPLQTLRKTI
jgi:putative ABC transport system permease protein